MLAKIYRPSFLFVLAVLCLAGCEIQTDEILVSDEGAPKVIGPNFFWADMPNNAEGELVIGGQPLEIDGHINVAFQNIKQYFLLTEEMLEQLTSKADVDCPDGLNIEYRLFKPKISTYQQSVFGSTKSGKGYSIRCAATITADDGLDRGFEKIEITLPCASEICSRFNIDEVPAKLEFHVNVIGPHEQPGD